LNAGISVINQEVTRGGEFGQEYLILIMLGGGFEFGKGDHGHGEEVGLLGFWGRCLGRDRGGDRELHFLGAPVDCRIPFFEPRKTQNDVMVGEGDYMEVKVFFMSWEFQMCSDHGFVAFIEGAIGEVDGG
jgi:hypothetical protein